MGPAQGGMMPISFLTPLLPPPLWLTLSTSAIWFPPYSLPWGHCAALLSTWNITTFGTTQIRLYFSRIVTTDSQLPSNFAQCYLYKIYLAHPIFVPPFSSCSPISFLLALTIFYCYAAYSLVIPKWKHPKGRDLDLFHSLLWRSPLGWYQAQSRVQ